MNIGFLRISKPRSKSKEAQKREKQQDNEVQKTALQAMSEARGETIDRWVAVEGSATKTRQKRAIKMLLSSLGPGDVVWVVSIDRLARSVQELKATMDGIVTAKAGLVITNCDILSFRPGDKADSAMANLVRQVLGAVSEFELNLISERTQRGLARARSQGKTWGCDKKQAASMAARAQAEANMFAKSLKPKVAKLVKMGRTDTQICAHLNRAGILSRTGGKWYPSSVGNLLRRLDLR